MRILLIACLGLCACSGGPRPMTPFQQQMLLMQMQQRPYQLTPPPSMGQIPQTHTYVCNPQGQSTVCSGQ